MFARRAVRIGADERPQPDGNRGRGRGREARQAREVEAVARREGPRDQGPAVREGDARVVVEDHRGAGDRGAPAHVPHEVDRDPGGPEQPDPDVVRLAVAQAGQGDRDLADLHRLVIALDLGVGPVAAVLVPRWIDHDNLDATPGVLAGLDRLSAARANAGAGLDQPGRRPRRITAVPGVATGLAYTPTGGDVLFIEATSMRGKNDFVLTGQLGDVMKESA